MLFITYHLVNLGIFVIAVIYAWVTVSKLRNTSATYNGRLLPFAYFSLSSWILWGFQYLILAGPFTDFFLDTGLWLGVMQNALWASAVLSLHSKQFSRMTTLPVWIVFPIVIALALLTYRTEVLTSEIFVYIDFVFGFVIFTGFAYSILQWRVSKIFAAIFFIHGYSQWLWRALWFSPWLGTQSAILMAFPVWRIALLFAWVRLISVILHRAESSYRKVVANIERLSLPKRLDKFTVMVGSTVDVVQERDAASHAIDKLGLSEIRAETFGSSSEPLRDVYTYLADQCDAFILLIGERYGSPMESDGLSVIEIQYQAARERDAKKILVYVKDSVIRELRLQDFLARVQATEHSYVRSFITPEDLYEEIHRGIAHWLTSHGKQ